eukprot:scaffold12330_cov83-Skeletonema_marinoi.AAC.2
MQTKNIDEFSGTDDNYLFSTNRGHQQMWYPTIIIAGDEMLSGSTVVPIVKVPRRQEMSE